MKDRIPGWPLGRLSIGLSLVIAAVLLGIFAHSSLSPTFRGDRAEAATVTVRIGDFWFCDPAGSQPCSQPHDTQVNVGDSVVWEWGAGGSGTSFFHTTTNCADNFTTCSGPREWDSSPSKFTGTFSHTFGAEDAGKTFLYRCQVHPSMQGRIIVQAIASPTPTPTPATPTPTPAAPTPTPGAAVGGIGDFPAIDDLPPETGGSSGDSSTQAYALTGAGVAAVAAVVTAIAAVWYVGRRRHDHTK